MMRTIYLLNAFIWVSIGIADEFHHRDGLRDMVIVLAFIALYEIRKIGEDRNLET